jgi:hypothetical protein
MADALRQGGYELGRSGHPGLMKIGEVLVVLVGRPRPPAKQTGRMWLELSYRTIRRVLCVSNTWKKAFASPSSQGQAPKLLVLCPRVECASTRALRYTVIPLTEVFLVKTAALPQKSNRKETAAGVEVTLARPSRPGCQIRLGCASRSDRMNKANVKRWSSRR